MFKSATVSQKLDYSLTSNEKNIQNKYSKSLIIIKCMLSTSSTSNISPGIVPLPLKRRPNAFKI
jgi:hypothetical protein